MKTSYKGIPAEELREMAKRRRQMAQESFDRCDTDGYLTQYALTSVADLLDALAELVTRNCIMEYTGLYEGDRRVLAKRITTKFSGHYSSSWVLEDEEAAKFGRKFVPAGEKSRIQKELGLRERPETQKTWATLEGTGGGLCCVHYYREGDKFGREAVLVNDSEDSINNADGGK